MFIEYLRNAVEDYNKKNLNSSFFVLDKDEYIYLYGSYNTRSSLVGRIKSDSDHKWYFWEFDYARDKYKEVFLTSESYDFDELLELVNHRLLNK